MSRDMKAEARMKIRKKMLEGAKLTEAITKLKRVSSGAIQSLGVKSLNETPFLDAIRKRQAMRQGKLDKIKHRRRQLIRKRFRQMMEIRSRNSYNLHTWTANDLKVLCQYKKVESDDAMPTTKAGLLARAIAVSGRESPLYPSSDDEPEVVEVDLTAEGTDDVEITNIDLNDRKMPAVGNNKQHSSNDKHGINNSDDAADDSNGDTDDEFNLPMDDDSKDFDDQDFDDQDFDDQDFDDTSDMKVYEV